MNLNVVANPLLLDEALPTFTAIQPEHIEPAINRIIEDNLLVIERLLQNVAPDWQTLIQPLHNLNDRLEKAWAPVSHMNAVIQNDALRAAHDACLPKLSEYHTLLGQHAGLFAAYTFIRSSQQFHTLSTAQKKTIENSLRDFRLSGIDLDEEKQKRFAAISSRLSELSSLFSNHVLDATQAWSKLLASDDDLPGLPETARNLAKAQALARQQEGFLLTLDAPCYVAVMTYANNRELRREMYEAYVTRASECGPQANKFDNTAIIQETLALRFELANLLGFTDYAEYSLATKMAETPQHVVDFLWQLVGASKAAALFEFNQLKQFAAEQYGLHELQSWDVAWLSEKLREKSFAVDQEQLRQYFPLSVVLSGLFSVIKKLFSVDIVQEKDVDLWHSDAGAYAVVRDDNVIARFYTDLYARDNKRGGAWMGDCRVRRVLDDGSMQLPVAFLVCNFMPPSNAQPCLLTFNDVTTLFHEFGHGLHHMLTQVDCAPVSGINGVEWDAVELPSQFLENWCWHPDVIPMISSHFETGEALPVDMLDKMLAAKNFQSGIQMLRQLEFSLFDFLLHWKHDQHQSVQPVIDEVRRETALIPAPLFNRFQNSFTHIFAGGYAAGYYSYKWAEVLSADAFSAFEESGIFDAATSGRFLAEVLESGGTEDAMTLFRRFRGREPNADALLRHADLARREGVA
ncbi:MAG TPA: M3 family metallopeptidase [Pseudomonadales bacterium]|nr:M3 family metallopeptidase [Pseudomonadales bacterium]